MGFGATRLYPSYENRFILRGFTHSTAQVRLAKRNRTYEVFLLPRVRR